MNAIDIFILIILLIGGLNGLRQGFVKAFANLIGWILALILGAKFAPSMVSLSEDPVVQKIAAFAFIVLVIVVLTWFVTALLNNILKSLKLGPLNRLAGGAFGSLKGLLIVLITMQGVGSWVETSPYWKQSKFVQTLLPYAPFAMQLSKEAANEAMSHIKSEDAHVSSDSSPKISSKNAEGQGESTNNPLTKCCLMH